MSSSVAPPRSGSRSRSPRALPSPRREPVRIEQVGWLTGCWEMSSPQRTIEEHWLPPRGGTMLGIGRTVQGRPHDRAPNRS